MKKFWIIGVLLVFFANAAWAQYLFNWTGANSQDWDDPLNWDDGFGNDWNLIPSPLDNVEIGPGAPFLTVDLNISPLLISSGFSIEFTDLVRILGIFLDNAIEECMELDNGIIAIKISRNDDMISFIIKNTIKPGTKEKGIKPNQSSKGEGRGNGLIIIHDIIERSNNITLNSFFQNDSYVQNLIIHIVS